MPKLPNPNLPGSPEKVTVIGDDGVPTTYVKVQEPDGTYAYIPEDQIPQATAPATGDILPLWAALAGLSAAGIGFAVRKKRSKA